MARDYLGRDQQFYDKLYDFGVDQMNGDSSPADIGFDHEGTFVTNPFYETTGRFTHDIDGAYDMYGDDNVNNWITAAMKVIDAKNQDEDRINWDVPDIPYVIGESPDEAFYAWNADGRDEDVLDAWTAHLASLPNDTLRKMAGKELSIIDNMSKDYPDDQDPWNSAALQHLSNYIPKEFVRAPTEHWNSPEAQWGDMKNIANNRRYAEALQYIRGSLAKQGLRGNQLDDAVNDIIVSFTDVDGNGYIPDDFHDYDRHIYDSAMRTDTQNNIKNAIAGRKY